MFEKIIISIIKSFTTIKYSLSNSISSNGFDEVRAEEILRKLHDCSSDLVGKTDKEVVKKLKEKYPEEDIPKHSGKSDFKLRFTLNRYDEPYLVTIDLDHDNKSKVMLGFNQEYNGLWLWINKRDPSDWFYQIDPPPSSPMGVWAKQMGRFLSLKCGAGDISNMGF